MMVVKNVKKTIKYLKNGEYHYATVKDVGDIEKLLTKNKTDLVGAINEIIKGGVSSSVDREEITKEIQETVSQTSKDLIKKVEELSAESAEEFNKKVQEAIEETNTAIINHTKDLAEKIISVEENANEQYGTISEEIKTLEKETQSLVEETKAAIDESTKGIVKNVADLTEKAETLSGEIDAAKTIIEETNQELTNVNIGFGEVKQTVDDVKGEIKNLATSAEVDELGETLEIVKTEITTTKDGIEKSINQKISDLKTGAIKNLETTIGEHADLIEKKVSKTELVKDLVDFQVKKANLLTGTREFLGWKIDDVESTHVSEDSYNHSRIVDLTEIGTGISLLVENLEVGKTYTVAIDGKLQHTADKIKIEAVGIGALKNINDSELVNGQFERYSISFVAKTVNQEIKFVARGVFTKSNVLHLVMPKLETGSMGTPYEQNVNDTYARIEHVEASQKIYNDQVSTVVKKQTEQGESLKEAQMAVNQLSDSFEIQADQIEKNGNDISEAKSSFELTAKNLKTEFEQSTTAKINAIQDSGTNMIQNSAFVSELEKWQGVSKQAKIVEVANYKWLNLIQSGLTAESPIAAQTNYFPVEKDDSLIIAFDFITKSAQMYDVKTPIVIEYFNLENVRVDFKELTLKDLGAENIGSNVAKRLTYKTSIDRDDVKKAAIKPILKKNGDVLYTNFFAKISTINDGEYVPNPQDIMSEQAKQRFEIETNAEGLKAKASKSEINALDQKVKESTLAMEANTKEFGVKLSEVQNDSKHIKESVQSNLRKIGDVEQKTSQVDAKAKELANTVGNIPAYIQSRGQNLVTNGYGTLKSNQNFSTLKFNPAQREVGSGSFESTVQNSLWFTDEFIEVDLKKKYGYSYYAKTALGLTKSYAMLVPYDVDNRQIEASMTAKKGTFNPLIEPTITTLTKELKVGDMEIHLNSVSGFADYEVNTLNGHHNSILFWGYKNSLGYEYPVGSYSRLVGTRLWTKGQVDNKTNIIKLLAPFSIKNPSTVDGSYPVGHKVSPTQSGGTYIYPSGAVNVKIPTKWTKFDLEVDCSNMVPMGTAKIKVGGLFNRESSGGVDTTWYNGIEFTDRTAIDKVEEETELKLGEIRTSVQSAEEKSSKKFAEFKATTEKISQTIGEVSSSSKNEISKLDTKFAGAVSDTKKALEGEISKISQQVTTSNNENEKKWAENETSKNQIKQSVNTLSSSTTKSINETKDSVTAADKKINEVNKKVTTIETNVNKEVAAIKVENGKVNTKVSNLESSVKSTKKELDEISFGVENLIQDSDFGSQLLDDGATWTKNGETDVSFSEDEKGKITANIKSKTAAGLWRGISQTVPIKAKKGEKLTFSLSLSAPIGNVSRLNVILHYRKGGAIAAQEKNLFLATETEERLFFTYTVGADTDEIVLMVYGENDKSFNLNLSKLQLELGKYMTGWKRSVEEAVTLDTRLRQVEQDITDGSVTTSISDVREFAEGLLGEIEGKIGTEEIADFVTQESLDDQISEAKEYANEQIHNLDIKKYVEQSEFQQLRDRFNFNISNSGGINLLRNSIGYSLLDYWSQSGVVNSSTDKSIESAGFGSGFKFNNGRITQAVEGSGMTSYTLSFYLFATGKVTAGAEIFVDNKKIHFTGVSKGNTDGFQYFKQTFEAPTGNIRIELLGSSGGEGTITGVMLNAGEVDLAWQSHLEEMYNQNIRFDSRGITVKNEDDQGYTNITPKEFAGYGMVNGQLQRVFSVNNDLTKVTKLEAEEELTMKPIKIVSITEGSSVGWAFVGM